LIEKLSYSLGIVSRNLFISSEPRGIIKQAQLDEPVARFLDRIQTESGITWVLVHALGAGEYYDSNRNGDIFYEKSLNNFPSSWTGDPDIDRVAANSVFYGAPTFYGGNVFVGHRNKDPNRSVGSIEFVHWNDFMKRVELILKIDQSKLAEVDAGWVARKLEDGSLIDVSMGSKVPYDLCEPFYDREKYEHALSTYDPSVHRNVAQAVLMYHKKDPIYGLSVTRNDYIPAAKFELNKVTPEGKKVMLDNPFPRFFDISFVYIGAEEPAKVMWKIATKCEIIGHKCAKCTGSCEKFTMGGALAMEKEKIAMDRTAKLKKSTVKKSTIEKEVPSQFTPEATGKEQDNYPDLPSSTIDGLSEHPVDHVLSTLGGAGIVLKPHEFQRLVLIRIGKRDLADRLDEENKVFSPCSEIDETIPFTHDSFIPHIFEKIREFLPFRSLFPMFNTPAIRVKRIIHIIVSKRDPIKDELLDKISALYNGYRKRLFEGMEKESALIMHQNRCLRDELYKFGSIGKIDVFPFLRF